MTTAELPEPVTAPDGSLWQRKPDATAAWTNAAGLMLYPAIYGAHWTVRHPDGTEAHRYTLTEALAHAAAFAQ